MMRLPKQIPIQSLLYKTTTCLTLPATDFPKWKKACLKQPLQNFIQQKNAKKNKDQCIKNKCLSHYIYFVASL